MSHGSQQLRMFHIAMRDGSTIEAAAELAGMSMIEAKLHVADDAKNPPSPEAYVLIGHNKGPTMAETKDDRLRLLIERVERLESEKKGISDDIKDVYLEAKAVGYDVKVMKDVIKLRKMEPDARREREALLDLYKAALGLDYSATPLGAATIQRATEMAH